LTYRFFNKRRIREQLEGDFDVVNIKWLDSFLRHQWISENGYISSSQLFENIKNKKLKNKPPIIVLEYIKNLREDARFYIGLRSCDPKYLGKKFNNDSPKIDIRRYREEILEKLEFMKILGLGQVYEILLSLYKKFESSQFYTSKQFFRDIERLWIFSFAVTYSSLSPSKYESDVLISEIRPPILIFCPNIILSNNNRPLRRPFETIDTVEERRFPTTRRTDKQYKLPPMNLKVDTMKHGDILLPDMKTFL
jgi:hypothetical protein